MMTVPTTLSSQTKQPRPNSPGAGIIGLGSALPEQVRTNDHWDAATVAGWTIAAGKRAETFAAWADNENLNENQRAVIDAIVAQSKDPFGGSRRRHVARSEELGSRFEAIAARRAIRDADIAPEAIDVILGYGGVPDHLVTPNVCKAHESLGLRRDVLSIGTDAGCNSFAQQLDLAAMMVQSGRARYVLCVQSTVPSALSPPNAPFAPWFGDGGTAIVVGPVAPGEGFLASAHRTDGSQFEATFAGIEGNLKRWYEDGRIYWQIGDRVASRDMLVNIADHAEEVVGDVMHQIGQPRDVVDFYACHQGVSWLRAVTQTALGLDHARTFDTFPHLGSVWACNLPLVMDMARRDNLLRRGDLVVTFSGGSGATFTSLAMRWCA